MMSAPNGGDTRSALVLGGGGVAGIAWELGVLQGLADAGVHVVDAHVVVGTSAGAAVAAQITSGVPLADLYERQLGPAEQSGEIMAELDIESLTTMFVDALRNASSAREMRAAVGRAALTAPTVDEPTRRAVIVHRLPVHEWPTGRDVRIVAADAETGETVVFSGAHQAPLVDAVAASCAVPGVWPPVTIGARRYIDGGVRSATNTDLAEGCGTVLVLAPTADTPGVSDPETLAAIESMERSSHVLWIRPDVASTEAIGANPLDPATREPAARAGRAQGRTIAADVAPTWSAACPAEGEP